MVDVIEEDNEYNFCKSERDELADLSGVTLRFMLSPSSVLTSSSGCKIGGSIAFIDEGQEEGRGELNIGDPIELIDIRESFNCASEGADEGS